MEQSPLRAWDAARWRLGGERDVWERRMSGYGVLTPGGGRRGVGLRGKREEEEEVSTGADQLFMVSTVERGNAPALLPGPGSLLV